MPRTKTTRVYKDNSRRLQVLCMLAALAIVWIVTIVLIMLRPPTEAVATQLRNQLRSVERSNPEADLNTALGHGDQRLIAINRPDGQKIPGVHDPAAIRRFGVRIIPEPETLPDPDELVRLQHAAFEYVSQYNVLLLKRLDPSGTAPATTMSTTMPLTTQSLGQPH